MGEAAFNLLQFGIQSAVGTAVPATALFPCDPGVIIDLDRAIQSPEEDFGVLSRHQPGRASSGIRGAEFPLTCLVRFEDIIRVFEMRLAGGIVPTGGPLYLWAYTLDETASTTKFLTWENADDAQGWRLFGGTVTDLELGFDALSAPGESPWKLSATVIGLNREAVTVTAGLSAPASMETVEGHLTTLLEGTTATAFASLAELSAHLIMYKLKISGDRPRRAYGSASDVASAYGIVKPEVTVEAMIKQSASAKSNIHDIYNASGSVPGERRWRVKAAGSAGKYLQIDHRVRFTSVPIGERDGERVLHVQGHAVKDSTLASSLLITVANAVAS